MGVAPSLAGPLTTSLFSLSGADPSLPPTLSSNCLFRALATQLGDRAHTHGSMRRDVVEYMRKNPEEFQAFLAEEDELSYEEYCECATHTHTL